MVVDPDHVVSLRQQLHDMMLAGRIVKPVAGEAAKFHRLFLTPSPGNNYNVTDSFHFVKETCKKDPNLYVPSLDVDFLLTNDPLLAFVLTICLIMRVHLKFSPCKNFMIK